MDRPDDLSARIWLGWDEEYLHVAARVIDDVHIQRQDGERLWRDDCVQFALDTRNNALSPELSGETGYDGDDFNFAMALAGNGPQLYCFVDGGSTGPRDRASYPLVIRARRRRDAV